jgi:hypothetical protein
MQKFILRGQNPTWATIDSARYALVLVSLDFRKARTEWSKLSNGWRATADEDGQYCFAVAL